MEDARLARIRAHVQRIDELDALLHHGIAEARSAMQSWGGDAHARIESAATAFRADADANHAIERTRAATHATAEVEQLAPHDAGRLFTDPDFGQFTDLGVQSAYRFGELLTGGQGGVPTRTGIPAALPLVTEGNTTIVHQTPIGRSIARQLVVGMVTRLLATAPAGHVLVHLIDPVGLGEGIAPFMRAMDTAPWLIQDGVVVEGRDISERLERLRDRIVTIQTQYLGGEHTTMRAFNEAAGDVVEPTVLVVMFDVPAGLSGGAAQDLKMLLRSGPATSLHTLCTVDSTAQMPAGLPLADLYATSNVLRARPDGSVRWRPWGHALSADARAVGELTVAPDAAPTPAVIGEVTGRAAEQAATASGKVTPLTGLVPAQNNWWQDTSIGGLSVPVGTMGTRPTNLTLGDDPVHALVIGKTGSGKSTLLHSWVLSLATALSPDELELYLVDMKEGVEFKRYGQSGEAFLPHAKVVAMESDREFALAVLQKLKDEIKRRGKLQRQAGEGINHIDKLRETGQSMPRIVCIVDEFQKLFEADDRLGSRAASLLEQVAREGRAFGVHLIMASQSLRSLGALVGGQRAATFGQFGLRVALKAGSPEDSEMVLGDPSAARLERRGLAIVNDRGGAKGAATRMQVAYANDDEQHEIITALHAKALSRGPLAAPVVFEGSAPARLDENPEIDPTSVAAPTLFLGPAVAFAPPAAVQLEPDPGRHVAIIGQGSFDEESDMPLGFTMLANSVLGLAMTAPRGSRFVFLNCVSARRADDPNHPVNIPNALAPALAGHHVDILDEAADRGKALQTIAGLLESRSAEDAPIFLVGMDLHRDQTLQNDPMARRRGSEEMDPAAALQHILVNGPDAGVHLLAAFASVDQLKTTVGRDGIKHIGLRIVANALPAEVSDLIPVWSPSARIGQRRAVVWDGEQADSYMKFIPWQHPHADNVAAIAARAPQPLEVTVPIADLAPPEPQTQTDTEEASSPASAHVPAAPVSSATGDAGSASSELDAIRERLAKRRAERKAARAASDGPGATPPQALSDADTDTAASPDEQLSAIRERLAKRRAERAQRANNEAAADTIAGETLPPPRVEQEASDVE